MKVSLEIKPETVKSGFFSTAKVHMLHVQIDLSKEEWAAADSMGITNATILSYEGTVAKRKEDADFDWPRIVELERFREYAKRNYAFDNVIAAQGAIKQIKENLTNLKSHLEVAHQPTSESFEL